MVIMVVRYHQNFFNMLYSMQSYWMQCVKNVVNECGLPYIWETRNFVSIDWIRVQRILLDHFIQKWKNDVFTSPKSINYRIFKKNLCLEDYLLILLQKMAIDFCKFRLCNMKYETGRWSGIAIDDRKCLLCD